LKHILLVCVYVLGILMAGLKYVRFREIQQLEENKITELLQTVLSSISASSTIIQENQPPIQNGTESLHAAEIGKKITSSPRPCNQWTSTGDDIHAWFAYHRISTQLRDLFDFQSSEEMIDYAQLLNENPEKQMTIYARIFTQKYGHDLAPHDFIQFTNALKKLLHENRPSSSSIKPGSPLIVKSSACAIS
jgi:hypothetical protein